MYCRYCGSPVNDGSPYCSNCGVQIDKDSNAGVSEDSASFGFAVLGFLIPIVGFILFLVYEGKKPKRSKSAGKGALIGFIARSILAIILAILYVLFAASLLRNMPDSTKSVPSAIGGIYQEDTTDEILENDVDISFGTFEITNTGYSCKTALAVTVKNKAETQYSYYITIEAVDANGTRIDTDMIVADRLRPGQDICLTAFKYIPQEKLDQFNNATFRVLEIMRFDF